MHKIIQGLNMQQAKPSKAAPQAEKQAPFSLPKHRKENSSVYTIDNCNAPANTSLRCRVEHRKSGNVIILSLRSDPSGHIIYEHPPRQYPLKRLRTELMQLSPDLQLTRVAQELLPEFWSGCYNPSSGGIARRKDHPPSLRILWYADRNALRDLYTWSPATTLHYQHTLDVLLAHTDCLCWSDATPDQVAPILDHLSPSQAEDCIRLIRYLWRHQIALGLDATDVWETYTLTGRPHRPSHNALMARHINPVMLSDGQVWDVMQYCLPLIATPQGGYALGTMLLVGLGVDWDELAGLRCGDIYRSTRYPLAALSTTHKYSPVTGHKGGNYRLQPLAQPHKIRYLPLSAILTQAIDGRLKYVTQKSEGNIDNTPLIAAHNNIQRHVARSQFKKWLDTRLRPNIPSLPQKPELSKLMASAAQHNLPLHGYSNDDLRYQLGLRPNSVVAKHYCDYQADSTLYRLVATQDRWLALCRLTRALGSLPVPIVKRREITIEHSSACSIDCTVDIAALLSGYSDGDLLITLTSTCSTDITVSHSS